MVTRSRSTQAIVLELLSAAPDGRLATADLIRAADVFDVSDNNVRVTLARLKRRGLVAAAGRGFHRLGPAAAMVQSQVAAWRERDAALCSWNGRWLGVHMAALSRTDRAQVRQRERALQLAGFREIVTGLALRPDNLRGSVPAMRERLRQAGLDDEALVMGIDSLDARRREELIASWQPAVLDARYRELAAGLDEASQELDRLPLREAAALAFMRGGDAIRAIVLDPLLPDGIVDGAARARLFDTMRAFDSQGRALWARVIRQQQQESHVSPG